MRRSGRVREGAGLRADEEDAYVEYVRGRVLALRRTAYTLCGDWHEANDLVQAALIRLYRHWGRARAADAPDAYARRIEGLDVNETARALGCSAGTVKSPTSYAIAALRRLMPEYVGSGE